MNILLGLEFCMGFVCVGSTERHHCLQLLIAPQLRPCRSFIQKEMANQSGVNAVLNNCRQMDT